MGRYIARSAGITVLAPHAADVVGFFQQDEIRAPGLLQTDRQTQSAKSGADNQNFCFHAVTLSE